MGPFCAILGVEDVIEAGYTSSFLRLTGCKEWLTFCAPFCLEVIMRSCDSETLDFSG